MSVLAQVINVPGVLTLKSYSKKNKFPEFQNAYFSTENSMFLKIDLHSCSACEVNHA